MKLNKVVFFVLALFFSLYADDLRGLTGTDIEEYAVQFDQRTIDTCKALFARWQLNPGRNLYRVTTFGNSITYGENHWEGFNRPVRNIADSAQINAFKDSTFAANSWCTAANCKGSGNGNMAGESIGSVRGWACTDKVVEKHKSMIASIMIGTNDINNSTWNGPPSVSAYRQAVDCIVSKGTIPIITTIPPINGNSSSWSHSFDPDSLLLPYNDSLRAEAQRRGVPLLDLHRWYMDHGGPEQLNYDWAHPIDCGWWGIDFSDDCLDGGTSGSANNARNYLLMLAVHDIIKYVVKAEPMSSNEKQDYLSHGSSISISPNPFNPSTVITVEGKSDARVKVYGLKGNLVQTLGGSLHSGRNNFVFNASALPSGVYVVVAKIDGRECSKKMILQK